MKKPGKKTTLIGGAIILTLSLLLLRNCPPPTCSIDISQEANIDLTLHEVIPSTARQEIKTFRLNVLNGTDSIDRIAETINSEAFCTLKQAADDLHGACSNTACANCDNYITGVKIIYTYKNNTQVGLIFQPLFLCSKDATTPAPGDYEYNVVAGSKYYSYNTSIGDFSEAPYDGTKNTYYTTTKIARRTGLSPSAYSNDSADVKSLIFSFREIKQLITDNNNCATVVFWNALIDVTKNNIITRKHSLLIGPPDVSGVEKFYDFRGKFANRSNLCPPDCDSFKFRVIASNPK